jgi:two-component system chemotaxis response regulator CheY
MPQLDGLSFLKAMREKRDYRFTPVVMLTTESRAQRKQQAKDSGATAWATKPCPPSDLVQLVQRLTV